MELLAGVDEVASETQVSEGWTYALLPSSSITAIDAAVSKCAVTHFHGKRFKKSQAADYQAFLSAGRHELEQAACGILMFTLLESSWKATLVPFAQRLISNSMVIAGVTD